MVRGTQKTEARRYYRALATKDRRWDGRIFYAVRSTGIYCRPICPARLPLFKNVEFFSTAGAAQQAGYRPCLRCRPETGPGTPAWKGTFATVVRALRLLEADSVSGLGSLADRLGVTERHLRRLFVEHLGAPPQVVLQMRRLNLARHLLIETARPITEVGLASGFESVRRFNDAFRKQFGLSPSQMRQPTLARKSTMPDFRFDTMNTPVGQVTLVAVEGGLAAVLWEEEREGRVRFPKVPRRDERDPVLVQTKQQLKEYFAGKRREFDLPLSPLGTPFQKQAWEALRRIPYGSTATYSEQARDMGQSGKARAVGAANGRNPLSIVVPCHRVIGKNGSLTGFAGGLKAKQFLLALESDVRRKRESR